MNIQLATSDISVLQSGGGRLRGSSVGGGGRTIGGRTRGGRIRGGGGGRGEIFFKF